MITAYVLIAMCWFAFLLGKANVSAYRQTTSASMYVFSSLCLAVFWPLVTLAIIWSIIKLAL